MPTDHAWPAPLLVRPYVVNEFRAMASPCRIVADTEQLARAGERMVHDLESRWTRFRPTSEVNAVNRASGQFVVVSDLTARLFELADSARSATHGQFNPLVLDRLEQLGYHSHGASSTAVAGPPDRSEPVENRSIDVLRAACAVRLPAGSRFDPGGIGKGLAGDIVLEHLRSLGARSVQIELGGDVRVWGDNWTGRPWQVDVQDPRDRTRNLTRLELAEGAIATSSVLGRRWTIGDRELHHLIDPSTGQPGDTDVLSVTTTSSELWWAEVVAKVAVLAGSLRAPAVLQAFDCSGVVLDRRGNVVFVSADRHDRGSSKVAS